ncbi:MAG TPA: M1 family metallopeptidase [Candidatus Saccharimonadales bacterium]|nr:M1 family metallopeptidase [Candidatus Saccharimonadales bacterium]
MPELIRHLSPLFKVDNYKLHIDLLSAHKRDFSGQVIIAGKLPKNSKTITLHSKGLRISKLKVNNTAVRFKQGSHDELQINGDFAKGEQVITIEFSGKITETLAGIYACPYQYLGNDKEIFATQFESHSAREAFPCIDEPAAKATFDLTLTTKKGLVALANTPVKKQVTHELSQITTFERTPKMSTYLLAFAAGELGFTETTSASGVKIRAYSTLDHVGETEFVLNVAAKFLDYFDDYFGTPYPLPKCDLLALPDFSAGAMENWGLVTFRESCMFVGPGTPIATKQFNAMVVGHELAHQWFGNLVTMQWWDDLWLNESFANWMGYKVVDHFYPEWRYWEHFNDFEALRAYARDSLATIQSVRQPLNDPEEIASLFDSAIMYSKGACLVRMLHDYLGEQNFKNGIRAYVKKFSYKNATMQDLWESLGSVAQIEVADFIEPWLTQPGHPVVSFRQTNGHATLNQRRFYADPRAARNSDDAIWPIPLLGNSVEQKILKDRTTQVKLKSEDLNLLNQGAGGFYHVQYDSGELKDIVNNLEQLKTLDRQKLLHDMLALTRAGLVSTSDTLRLLSAFANETQYSVWSAIASILGATEFLISDAQKLHFNKFVNNLIKKQLNHLGLKPLGDESYNDNLLRPVILNLAVLGENKLANQQMLQVFRQAGKTNDLPVEGREVFYSSVGKIGETQDFAKLLNWYKTTSSAQEKLLLTAGLTSTKSESQITEILNLLPTNKIRNQDVPFWLLRLMRNPASKKLTWHWAHANWGWLENTFKGDLHYSDLPQYFASGFSTELELAKFKKFFEQKLDDQGLRRNISQAIEDIEVKVLWRARDENLVAEFLESIK